MILKDKKIVIMGIRNKWSIAWGTAQSAYEQGAQVIFTCGSMEKIEKIKELTNEIPNSDVFACDASSDESIKECIEKIKEKYGKIDGILHAIAHANTEDLRNDFINTTRDGFAHAYVLAPGISFINFSVFSPLSGVLCVKITSAPFSIAD